MPNKPENTETKKTMPVHRKLPSSTKTSKPKTNKRETEFRKLFFLINLSVALHEIVYDSSGKAIDYKIIDVNPMYETVTGISKKQAVGKCPTQIFHVAKAPNLDIYAEVASSGKSQSFETYFPAMAIYAQVFVFSTKLGTFTTIISDITEKKKTEEALKLSEIENRELLETANSIIIRWDSNRKIKFINDFGLRFFGYSADELIGNDIMILVPHVDTHGRDMDIFVKDIITNTQNHPSSSNENIRKDGSIVQVMWTNKAIYDSQGQVKEILAIGNDITELKVIERQLRQRAEELETVMNVVPVAIWVAHDPACHNITGNETANRFYEAEEGENVSAGPAPGEVLPERRFFRNGKELTAEELPMQEAAARNDDIQGSEFSVLLPSGKSRTLWGSASPLRNDDGQVRGVVAAFLDITDRTLEQEKLKESEDRFSKAFHSSPGALSISRINDGTFLDVNQSFLNMYGYKREELIGRKATELNIYDDPVERKEIVRQLEKQGKLLNYEVTARTKSGTEINALTSAEKIEIHGQAHIIWTTIDITDRKKAEKALLESEEKFSKIFHSSPVGMVMTHLPEGRCVNVNEAYLIMLEYSREDVVGRDSRDLNMHIDPQKRAEVFRLLGEQGKVTNIEMSFRTKTGRIIEMLSSIDTINVQGQEYSLSTNIDITQRKQAETEINQLNRELRAINECNQVIVHASDEKPFLFDVCRILCTSAGYRMAWIASVEHDEAKSVIPLAWYGDEGYIDNANITWANTERGQGPAGVAARTGRTHFFQDFATDPVAIPWREAALSRGYRSSIAVPLFTSEGTVFGLFSLYSPEPDSFNTAEIRLLEELAANISFGVIALREKMRRQRAEAEISHLASFPELNPSPVLEIEPNGKIVYANPAAKIHFPLMIQGKKHQFLTDFINSMKKIGTDSITKDIKIGDSWYEETLAFVLSTKNYMLYARDVTERKNAEVALQETRDYLNNLLNYANAPIIVWDPLFHITQFNHAFERLTGRAAEDVIGKQLDILFPEEQRAHAMEHIRRAVSGERMEVEEISIQHKDGSIRTVLWNSATLFDQDSKTPLATIAQGQDITERKAAEDELKQRTMDLEASNKELEAFSYSVSHDLRAPLRSITGFSTVLLEDYNDELDNEGKSYLKKISDSGELMGQLMDDLLKLSRVTRSDLNMEKLDLSDMAQKIVNGLTEDEPKRKVKVMIAPNMTANGDKNLIGLVLQNLLGNAWKYSSKTSEPRIEMGTLEHNGKQAYFVRDNGVGFDMTYANKLFQPFQRLHKATEFSGTGIGLATVQRIIRRHGGEVWAESKVGEGATFYFTLN
jgi:PAS domain S-box-containing protein